jgi:hypothetical protein
MIDNVGDMPLDIFGDYLTDILDQEWSWEYLISIFNGDGYDNNTEFEIQGCGFQTFAYTTEILSYGDGSTSVGISYSCYNETMNRYYGDGESNTFGASHRYNNWLGCG